LAFLITLGGWEEGGDLMLPQLGVSLKPLPCDIVGFQAGRLLHWTTPPTRGERLVLTLFTDNFLYTSTSNLREVWSTDMKEYFVQKKKL
jgi:hypothetical protein